MTPRDAPPGGPLDAVAGWPVTAAAAGVVDPTGVLAVAGDRRRPFAWASVTKLLTALAVLVAVEEETVALDQPAGPPGATVAHLLAHASGLGSTDDTVLAPPGTRRIYSNHGYEVVAAVVADAAGMPFTEYLTAAVLDPLGLAATHLTGTPASGAVGPMDDLLALGVELLTPTVLAPADPRPGDHHRLSGPRRRAPGAGAPRPERLGARPRAA